MESIDPFLSLAVFAIGATPITPTGKLSALKKIEQIPYNEQVCRNHGKVALARRMPATGGLTH